MHYCYDKYTMIGTNGYFDGENLNKLRHFISSYTPET